jgi:hypothetical protein
MVLTRQEKEKLVLDLYNQGKSTREIAEEARMSFRDIGVILDKAEEEKEASKEQAEKVSQSTQAYKLFSEGKSPVQVAIALNIREPEVARFYVEYWKLRQLYSLYKIYEEIKDGIGPFVNLYTLAKVARMGVKQVVRLLEIANNDLPVVEHRYERSKRDLDSIEADKHNSARILQEISDQIATMCKTLDQYQLSCKEERLELTKIQLQKVRLEGLVDNFQNNDQGYVKIRNTVEEKVISILSDKKTLLKLALLSLTESIRKDPDKFNAFIFCDNKSLSSTTQTRGYSQYYDTVPYGQQQQRQQYSSQDCIDVLLEEAEKLYNKLSKELVGEIISDYGCSISSSLIPLLPPSEERESNPTTTTAANQTHMHTEEHGFTQSEINDDY